MKKPVRPIKPLQKDMKASLIPPTQEYIESYFLCEKISDATSALLKYDEIHINSEENTEEEIEDFHTNYTVWFSDDPNIKIQSLIDLCNKYKLDPELTTLSQAWLWSNQPSLCLNVQRTRTEKEIEAVEKENERKRKKYEADLKKYEKDLAKYKKDKARWDIEQAKKKLAKLS